MPDDFVKAIRRLCDSNPPDMAWLIERYPIDFLALGVTAFSYEKIGDWAYFSCREDWLAKLLLRFEIEEIFKRVLPIPEVGPNDCHQEIYLMAYADNIVTATKDGVVYLKGKPAALPQDLLAKLNCLSGGRAIAFSMPDGLS